MKKIALCSLLVCLGASFNAYAGCNPNNAVSYVGNQEPDHDEYLYMNVSEYNKSVNGWENTNHQNSGDGHAYECDAPGLFSRSAGCENGDEVTMPEGHVFKGEVVNKMVKYRCHANSAYNTPYDDYWEPLPPEPGTFCETRWGNLDVGKYFGNKTETDCSGLNFSDDNKGLVSKWRVVCRQGPYLVCEPQECKTGYTVKDKKCVPDNCTFYDGSKHNLGDKIEVDCSQAPNTPEFQQNARTGVKCYQSCLRRLSDNALTNYWSVKTCPADKGFVAFDSADYQKYTPDIPGYKRCDVNELPEIVVTPEKKKSCKNSRSTANGKACCDLPASEASYDAQNDKCNCLNNKDFKIENGKGVCVAPQSTTANCKYKFKSIITCANGQYMSVDKETMVEAADCDEFNRLYGADLNKAMEIFGDLCAGVSPVYVPVHVGVDPVALGNATKTLDRFAASAKGEASGWKTADGKFNTTRLASDLSAGVVLGTVGGVVSGVVIKKKQVEKGFDALHCTVGGQKIADWGDEFSVGLQR